MEYLQLASIDTPVSRVALGGCPLGGYGWGEVDDRDSIATIHKAIDAGINFYDTADIYGLGHSEKILSRGLGADRESVVIATKFGVRQNNKGQSFYDVSPKWARKAVELSLQRLRVDAISLYYMHWPDGETVIEDVVGVLADLKQEGKILGIGLSNVSPEEVKRAASTTTISAIQVQYSLIDREVAEKLLRVTAEYKIPLVTWGSLGQGILSGKYNEASVFKSNDRRSRYENFKEPKLSQNLRVVKELVRTAKQSHATPSQVAIRWLLEQFGVRVALFGAKTFEQVSENVNAMNLRLSEKQLANLTQVACGQRMIREAC